MPLVPLDIPPGVVSNGTDFSAEGRWLDANLVRWKDGSLRPVRGWRTRVEDVTANPARGGIAWEANDGSRWLAFGSSNELSAVATDGTVTDITPAGLTAGIVDAEVNTGFSGGTYGTGFYGVSRPDTGNYSEATTWSLDVWGEYLLACSPADGQILEWQLNVLNDAAAVTNAPTSCLGLVVTEERFVFALGAGGNPRKIQWCDREDNTTWTPAGTNEAGDYELQTPGQIMAGVRTRGETLILTDADAHTATYVGPPFVYGFQRVGSQCGLAARKAVASTDQGVFWMGVGGFFRYAGGAVEEVPCDVWDYVFKDINTAQISKSWAMHIGQHGEVWFFFVSSDANEVDRYVVFDYKRGHWSIGQLARSCGVERGVFRTPIMTDTTSHAYDHETGFNYDGSLPYVESGPIKVGTGDAVISAVQMLPDELTQGEVTATFRTRFFPNGEERDYGPYSMANPTDVRFTGRQIRMRVTGSEGNDWRVGQMRLDMVAGGRR